MSLAQRASRLASTAATVNTRLDNMENITDRICLAMYDHEDGDFQRALEDEQVCVAVPELKADLLKCDTAWEHLEIAFWRLQDAVDGLVEKWSPKRKMLLKSMGDLQARRKRTVRALDLEEEEEEGGEVVAEQVAELEAQEDTNKRLRRNE
jgi:hypothetical protein